MLFSLLVYYCYFIRKSSKLQSVSTHIKQPKGVPTEDISNVTLDSDALVLDSR